LSDDFPEAVSCVVESKRQCNVAAEVEDGIYKMKNFASVAENNRQRIYGNFTVGVFTGSLRIDCQGASTERVSEVSVPATIAASDARAIPSA